jgi:hypothetical protein
MSWILPIPFLKDTIKENGAEYILTRNTKDFKNSIVKPITPEELLVILKSDILEENKNI